MLWSGIYLLLLLGLYSPLVLISAVSLMIPSLILWMKLTQRQFMMVYLVVILIISILTSNVGFLVLLSASLFYLVPSIVMGNMYKKNASPLAAVTAGVLALLAEMVLIIVVLSFLGVNVFEAARQFIWEGYQSMSGLLGQEFSHEMVSDLTYMASAMIPTTMIGYALFIAAITHWLSRLLLKPQVELKAFPPIRDWMLPKSLVWYYAIALLLNFMFRFEQGSMFYLILVNLIPMLAFAFAVQAIAFLFYITHVKRWNKALPVIGILTFPVTSPYLSILGVFDVAFGLRKGFDNK